MRRITLRSLLGLSLILNLALLPIVVNKHLRWQYAQTVAVWRAKIDRPTYVFLGDSITAGGRMFGRLDTINLATSGLTTMQVAAALPRAQSFNPHHVVVMAGINDVIAAGDQPLPTADLRRYWELLCSDPRVIVVVPTPTNNPTYNARLEVVARIIQNAARSSGRRVIEIKELSDKNGLLRERYSADGIHLTEDAYVFWESRLH